MGPAYDEQKMSQAASELYSLYHSPRPYATLEDGVEALRTLRAHHPRVTVGAVSNFDNRLHDILPSLGLAQHLHFVVTSEDAQSSKPEEKIFDFAAKKSGLHNLQPHEILHIGRYRYIKQYKVPKIVLNDFYQLIMAYQKLKL